MSKNFKDSQKSKRPLRALIKFLKDSFFIWGVIYLSYLAYRWFKNEEVSILFEVIIGGVVYLVYRVCKRNYKKRKNDDTIKGDDKKWVNTLKNLKN